MSTAPSPIDVPQERARIALSCFLASLLVVVIMAVALSGLHQAEVQASQVRAEERLRIVVSQTSKALDVDFHQEVATASSYEELKTDPAFASLRQVLVEAEETHRLPTPIYTLTVDDDDVARVIIDSTPNPCFGQQIPRPNSTGIGSPGVSDVIGPYHDAYGTWLSAVAPLCDDSGRCIALVQADLPYEDIGAAANARFQRRSWEVIAAGLVAIAFIALMALRSRRFVRAEREAREAGLRALRMARHEVESRTEFLTRLAHELTPTVDALSAESESVLRDLDPRRAQLDPPLRPLIARLNDRVRDLATLASWTRNETEHPHRWSFSLRDLLNDLCRDFEPMARERDLSLDCEIDPALPETFEGDAPKLRRALHKLLENAVAYTEVGEVTLGCRCRAGVDAPELVEFEVSDTGAGLPPELEGAAFDPYPTGPADEDPKQGLGVGLAIARHLVEGLGGTIAHERSEAGGSCFTFAIPLRSVEPSNRLERKDRAARRRIRADVESLRRRYASPPEHGRLADERLRVLIAEADPVNRRFLVALTDKWGCDHYPASDGHRAVTAYRERCFDLVIVDSALSGLDGFEVAHAIREIEASEPHRGRTPIIVVTAAVLNDSPEQSARAGIDAVIAKPYQPAELRERIAAVTLGPKATETVSDGDPTAASRHGG